MKAAHISPSKLKQQVRRVFDKHLDRSYHVFLFGSRVRGDNFDRSDVDIGIEGAGPVPIGTKFAIQDDLEQLPTLYRFDVVDFARVSDDFKREAYKHRELL